MLNSEKFFLRSNNLKDKNFVMRDYVVSMVRHKELEIALNNKAFKDGKKILENNHAAIDVLTCEESIIHSELKLEAGDFIKRRDEVIALKAECETCISMDKVTSLCLTDRVNITLMAHMIYKAIVLNSDIFDTDKGGIDIAPAVKAYYAKGSLKDLKDALRPIFNKLVGSEGDYFYAIKTKKSDFCESDLRNFLASFGGDAKQQTTKTKKNGVTTETYNGYNYVDKSENKKTQIAAFTTLCAVVLDNASKHDVVKTENN